MPRRRRVSKRRVAQLEDLFPDKDLKLIDIGDDHAAARVGMHCPHCQIEYDRRGERDIPDAWVAQHLAGTA